MQTTGYQRQLALATKRWSACMLPATWWRWLTQLPGPTMHHSCRCHVVTLTGKQLAADGMRLSWCTCCKVHSPLLCTLCQHDFSLTMGSSPASEGLAPKRWAPRKPSANGLACERQFIVCASARQHMKALCGAVSYKQRKRIGCRSMVHRP